MRAGRVTVVEVGPRDGLQNEPGFVSTDAKVAFVDALSAAGLPVIEVTAFVSPKAIPQLADGEDVFRRATRRPGVRYPVLVPNVKGLERAEAVGVREIAVFTAASETFNRRNINASIDESFARFAPVIGRAKAGGMRVRGYVSCAFGCPYEGDVAPGAVARVAARLAAAGCDEVSVGDTIGIGVPTQVPEVVGRAVEAGVPLDRLALHFHDTRGTALANVTEGLRAGVRIFDSSAGGLGGCPFAPGAAGNVATEDLLYLLHGMGCETGVDLPAVVEASRSLSVAIGRRPVSRVFQALDGGAARRSV
ncbi:MAG TPA: hydroxymethylglutaryl-CoA lyase [Thermoanaerobaculia bacterium]|nr:hydroxymethylglutaryl-CoA lyase [Thermoanaerobaculia bacterium]